MKLYPRKAKRYRGGDAMKARALLNRLGSPRYMGDQVTRHGVTPLYTLSTGEVVSENELSFIEDNARGVI
jgi:hypothetical protein